MFTNGIDWGSECKKMKEKMVANPLWLATAPATTYCLFEPLLGCWQAYTMFPELQVFQCQNSASFGLSFKFQWRGHRLGLHQEGPVGVTLSIGIWSYN